MNAGLIQVFLQDSVGDLIFTDQEEDAQITSKLLLQ